MGTVPRILHTHLTRWRQVEGGGHSHCLSISQGRWAGGPAISTIDGLFPRGQTTWASTFRRGRWCIFNLRLRCYILRWNPTTLLQRSRYAHLQIVSSFTQWNFSLIYVPHHILFLHFLHSEHDLQALPGISGTFRCPLPHDGNEVMTCISDPLWAVFLQAWRHRPQAWYSFMQIFRCTAHVSEQFGNTPLR